MGLAEKRAAKAFQDSRFPEIVSAVKAAIAKEIPIEVDWDSLMWEGCQDNFNDNWAYGCFLPLIDALKSVCSDDLGKDAVKHGLRKITVKGTYAHALSAKFEGGVLELDFAFYGQGAAGGPGSADFTDRAKHVRETLERGL